jgi:dTDP-4-dehydrorhamnose reductase
VDDLGRKRGLKRILITGGSSYLGQHLVPLAMRQHEICYTYHENDPLDLPCGEQLDLRDGSRVMKLIAEFQPDAIIHTAGSNRSPDMAAVISLGARHVTESARKNGARLIHMSTDVIFDGRNAPYQETDPPSPIHDYGRAKAAAEATVSQWANHVIVRTSLISGLSIMDRSTEWMSVALAEGRPVKLFDNQWRQPVWAETLSLACLELATSGYCGILNVAGDQTVSRAYFGLKMLDWWGVNQRDLVQVGPSDPKWPLDTRLDLTLAREKLTTPLLGLDQVIEMAQTRPAGSNLN